MTLIFGALFFRSVFSQNKIIGVVIGLLGTAGLILSGASVNPDQNYVYSLLVVLAASCYAFNVNILKTKMADISPLGIAAGNFASLLLPAVLILFFSGFFEQQLTSEIETSLVFVAILGIVGTGIAMIIFNKLVQISDPVFTTSVTYTIPIVALGWGILDGEIFSSWQLLSALVILVGVFIVNRSRNLIALKKVWCIKKTGTQAGFFSMQYQYYSTLKSSSETSSFTLISETLNSKDCGPMLCCKLNGNFTPFTS